MADQCSQAEDESSVLSASCGLKKFGGEDQRKF